MSTVNKMDLLVLTFNAGKAFASADCFADRMDLAFKENSDKGLPDLVFISLQEVSPIENAFVGGFALEPYLRRYVDGANTAASRFGATLANIDQPDEAAEDQHLLKPKTEPYTLVQQHNVGMTALMLLARDPDNVSDIQLAEVGFGKGDLGNKGAVAVRFMFADKGATGTALPRRTQFTLVSAHFIHNEVNVFRRNHNWQSIVQGLVFEDPVQVIRRAAREQDDISPIHRPTASMTPRDPASTLNATATAEEQEEARQLLAIAEEQHSALAEHIRDSLRDVSIFRLGSHLIVAGDLNYRTGDKRPYDADVRPSLDPNSPYNWARFVCRDQLTREKKAGNTLHGLEEPAIDFPPTYKYKVLKDPHGADNELDAIIAAQEGDSLKVVPYRLEKSRWASWTDRALYLPLLASAVRRLLRTSAEDGTQLGVSDLAIEVNSYTSLPLISSSDHQPVIMRLAMPLLTPKEMGRKPEEAIAAAEANDPRHVLPFPVDIHARARRARARRWELLAGYSGMVGMKPEVFVGTISVIVLAIGTYWLWYSL